MMKPLTTELPLFKHLDRLSEWQAGKLPPPVILELNLTNLCNHECPGCTFSQLVNISKDHIPFDIATRIIREAAAFGVKAITFSGGGEPLVYGQSRVLDLVLLARDRGLQVALITNGSLLTDPRFLDVCEWIRVSLDGWDEESFQKYHGRGEGEFKKVVMRTKMMAAEVAIRKYANERCATFGVGCLTEAGNFHSFGQMAVFCEQEFPGLDVIQFRPLVVNMLDDPTLNGGGWHTQTEDCLDLLQQKLESAQVLAPSIRVLWSESKYDALHQAQFGRNYRRCHAHFLEAVISADSKMYVCCHTQGQERFCLGDLNKTSFSDVWHSEHAKQVMDSFDSQTTCPPACKMHSYNVELENILRPVQFPNFL
jgi:MoaA/NifB/PqqE/SkfB family radical SAM enzyme